MVKCSRFGAEEVWARVSLWLRVLGLVLRGLRVYDSSRRWRVAT